MTTYPSRLAPHLHESDVDDSSLRSVALLFQLAGIDVEDPRATDDVWLTLVAALKAHGDGHACVDLRDDPSIVKALRLLDPLIAGNDERDRRPRRPFVIDGNLLYVARAHAEETSISVRIAQLAASGRLTILLGGPGTGKTTRVATRLVDVVSDDPEHRIEIALAAPTGKAADRMRRALAAAIERIKPDQEVATRLSALRATTVHRLLGYSPSRGDGRYRYHAGNHLPYDMVVVDEASMLSMSLMFRLLDALRPDATLMLVGDPDQLVSVDAGSVLGDLARVTEGPVPAVRTVLTETHRFDANSSLGRVIAATRLGDVDTVMSLLDSHRHGAKGSSDDGLTYVELGSDPAGMEWLASLVREWATRMTAAATAGDARSALAVQAELQVLCATRRGAMGTANWNRTVRGWLGVAATRTWYPGRPVMVTRNDVGNDLYNGDVGVVVAVDEPLVAFNGANGPRLVPPARLGDVETVHALTIHKSQGSEYDHAVVVLPEESRILSRELLYTGASRARTRLTVVGTRQAVRDAVMNDVRRATGLASRL